MGESSIKCHLLRKGKQSLNVYRGGRLIPPRPTAIVTLLPVGPLSQALPMQHDICQAEAETVAGVISISRTVKAMHTVFWHPCQKGNIHMVLLSSCPLGWKQWKPKLVIVITMHLNIYCALT